MTRALPEWIGKTPDTAAPPRVRLRVFDREQGKCHRCRRKIAAGDRWTLEHVTALVNGGRNAERNLAVTCNWCLPAKNAEDVAEKSRVNRKRAKHLGLHKPRSTLPGSRDSGWKKKIGGQVVRRGEG